MAHSLVEYFQNGEKQERMRNSIKIEFRASLRKPIQTYDWHEIYAESVDYGLMWFRGWTDEKLKQKGKKENMRAYEKYAENQEKRIEMLEQIIDNC